MANCKIFSNRLQKLLFFFLLPFCLFFCSTALTAATAITPAPQKTTQPSSTEQKKATSPTAATKTAPPASARNVTTPKAAAPEVQPPNPFSNLVGLERPSLVSQSVAIIFMSLLPFMVMILSSFVKIVVVLSLLRNALGVQQAPPNQVINGVALLLSIYVMFPTGVKMYDAAQTVMGRRPVPTDLVSGESAVYFLEVADAAKEPLRDFLKNNSLVKHQRIFYRTVYRLLPENYRDTLKPEDFLVIVPAFITSQLKSAFEIGVLIYIPFFVIDLVVSNILLAMGMMMLSPVTISMPLKLFLLVMLDGWTLLIQGLVATFR